MMKNNKLYFSLFFFLFVVCFGYSQTGTIVGLVTDGELNEPMAFANVQIKGTTKGASTDFEGKYVIQAEEGTYTLVFSFVGYTSTEITDVVVKAGQETDISVTLQAANVLDDVVVRATARQNTEASILNVQKKSITLLDGLSSQSIKKIGASDIANAVKNVPGVSVQGGKYVYVRGLGDRYTKSILNGMDIPGLDPDRNTIQMDIFPTNIIDNVIVVKSAAAEYPADFTGGVVDIITKDFPTKEEYSISVGAGYNPDMHFNDNYLEYEGSGTDFLGFDNDNRSLPVNRYQPVPGTFNNSTVLTTITDSFAKELKATTATSNPDFSLGFTAGNSFDVGGDNKLGYQVSLSYKNETRFYEDRVDGTWSKEQQDASFNELLATRTSLGQEGSNNVIVNGLAGITYKSEFSKYKLNFLHIQNGESTAGFYSQNVAQAGAGSGFEPIVKDALLYTQRSITNALLTGKHSFGEESKWGLEWKFSPTLTTVYDKDHRITPLQIQNNTFIISPSASSFPIRIWRNLTEENWAGKVDVDKNYDLGTRAAKVKFGGAYTYKYRDFSIDDFTFTLAGTNNTVPNGDSNFLLETENIWTPQNQTGTHIVFGDTFEAANSYEGEQRVAAAYISNEFNISEKFKAALGVRVEQFKLFYTGQNQAGTEVFNDSEILDELDLFPSANLIYELNDKSKIRASYSRTTARPSFKEASRIQIFDPITNRIFIGNLDLVPTYTNNFDLRYEFFGEGAEMFAISGFYKDITDPIELSFFLAAPDQLQPNNLGEATIIGGELEFRKSLGFISKSLEDLRLNINASVISSELTMFDAEFQARQLAARDGETVDRKRDMQGQSPYVLNAGLDYSNNEMGLQTGLFFNVQGKTLDVVGTGIVPDVYAQPFNSLNFTLNKKFGKDQRSAINLKISNILGDERESFYESFNAQDQIFTRFSPGISFSLGYSLKF